MYVDIGPFFNFGKMPVYPQHQGTRLLIILACTWSFAFLNTKNKTLANVPEVIFNSQDHVHVPDGQLLHYKVGSNFQLKPSA